MRPTLLAMTLPLLLACGPSCPALGSIRPDFPSSVNTGALTLTMKGNRLAQANDFAATLALSWTGGSGAEITVTDAQATPVLVHSEPTGTSANVRLIDAAGKPLPEGIYRVDVVVGQDRVSARFEVCHCTVYY
jgi:hypothetical protein